MLLIFVAASTVDSTELNNIEVSEFCNKILTNPQMVRATKNIEVILVKFFTNKKLTNLEIQKISNSRIYIYRQIGRLIETNHMLEAVNLFLNHSTLLQNCHNTLLASKLCDLQMDLLRFLINEKQFDFLRQMLSILIQEKEEFFLLVGVIHLACADYDKSLKALQRAMDLSSENKNISMIAKTYLYLGILEHRLGNKKKALSYWEAGAQHTPCLSSNLCRVVLGKNIPMYSVKELRIVNFIDKYNDSIMQKAMEEAKKDNYLTAINYLFSLKNEYFLQISKTMLDGIKFFQSTYEQCYLYKLGTLFYYKHGHMIQELFPAHRDALLLHNRGQISLKDIPLIMAIINQESKFYQIYFQGVQLNGPYAIGIAQIGRNEAKHLCKQYKIPYNLREILANNQTNIFLALKHLEHIGSFVRNIPYFQIFYYNGGSLSHKKMKSWNFLDLKDPFSLLILHECLDNMQAKSYLNKFMDHYILYYYAIMKKMPSITFLSESF